MVRHYANRPVERALVERILATARRAPSAGFTQGVCFVAVTDAETRARIAELAGESSYIAAGFDPWLSRAPVHVVVCVREEDYRERYSQADKLRAKKRQADWPVPYWWVDAGAALMLLLLAAIDEGLAAGFLGVHAFGDLKGLLAIPDDVAVLGVVTLGYPAPDRRSKSLARGWKPLEQVIRWERWG